MKCQEHDCRYIASQLSNIQKHYRVEHEWVNTRKKVGQEKGREVEVPWKAGVYCQHFFVRGPGAQFFEVASLTSPESQRIPSGDSGFKVAKQELAAALEKAKEEEQKKITEPEEAESQTRGYAGLDGSYLAGLDLHEVRELVEPVEEDKVELQVLYKAFN